jgi:hypothetical protein
MRSFLWRIGTFLFFAALGALAVLALAFFADLFFPYDVQELTQKNP